MLGKSGKVSAVFTNKRNKPEKSNLETLVVDKM